MESAARFRIYIGNSNWVTLGEQASADLQAIWARGQPVRYALAPGVYLDILPHDVDCNSKTTDLPCLMRADLCYDVPDDPENDKFQDNDDRNDNVPSNSSSSSSIGSTTSLTRSVLKPRRMTTSSSARNDDMARQAAQQALSVYVKQELEKQGIVDAFPPSKRRDAALPDVLSLHPHRHLALVPIAPKVKPPAASANMANRRNSYNSSKTVATTTNTTRSSSSTVSSSPPTQARTRVTKPPQPLKQKERRRRHPSSASSLSSASTTSPIPYQQHNHRALPPPPAATPLTTHEAASASSTHGSDMKPEEDSDDDTVPAASYVFQEASSSKLWPFSPIGASSVQPSHPLVPARPMFEHPSMYRHMGSSSSPSSMPLQAYHAPLYASMPFDSHHQRVPGTMDPMYASFDPQDDDSTLLMHSSWQRGGELIAHTVPQVPSAPLPRVDHDPHQYVHPQTQTNASNASFYPTMVETDMYVPMLPQQQPSNAPTIHPNHPNQPTQSARRTSSSTDSVVTTY
ncbi:hypothetical protein BC940DRAFT_287803 [Gongronella butleri]|nr:hypothetical protein BC940DRAFT_287803 [Gongronella butleri]